MVSPQVFREFFLPHMREAVNAIKKPWVFHSDGNILPLMDDLLELGMNAVHPIQPGAMDIEQIKARYGKRICLIGNIDLHYTLTRGLPLEVEEEVKNRIRIAGKDGAYIISSAMTITDYCKQENVIAMSNAIQMYGHYPLK
jgi:uroporphyrinogen decarboxylase